MVENYKKRKRIKYLNQVKAKIIKDMKANKKKYEQAKKKLFYNKKKFNHILKEFSNIFKLIEK